MTPHARDDNRAELRASPPGMPRWVKVFGIVAGIVVLLVAAAMFIMGGKHGPGRNLHGGGSGSVGVDSFVGLE